MASPLSALLRRAANGPWAVVTRLVLPPGADPDPLIDGITHDSRTARPGWLFCAVAGSRADGHLFANEAVNRGAAAVLVEREVRTTPPVPQIVAADVRAAMGPLAALVHDNPS